ncbi:MAG: tRNA pseudouridine(38-40) synthase TruA [Deltaproteobacteria bacterium]|nr:tRNA pseudouridine(38-40) synthase TruA [Deltaproteobacteria bacterium]MBN2673375.1 tRNA pseudouridine(38-40) synthase TruA [Deltaproteobacteria bacterium]
MPVYKLTIEYNGFKFSGWQIQRNAETVQGVLQRALHTALRQPVALQGASRTDAGVHAVGQTASFSFPFELDTHRLARSLCALSKPDIAVTNVELVNDDFNARFSAKGKHYIYRVLNRSAPSPLHGHLSWHVAASLDLLLMRECAAQLVGTHHFGGFRAADCERENTERTLTDVRIVETGTLLEIHVKGTAFLKNMVRIIAGTLVDIGRGALPENTITVLFDTQNRTLAGRTAPACGLTLMEVFYE